MDFKDLYNEIHYGLWGDVLEEDLGYKDLINEGYLISIHDPFHDSLANLKNNKTLEMNKIFLKFADKLYLETKDEYVVKILQDFANYVVRCNVDGDIADIGGSKYDPEFIFSSYDGSKANEPKQHQRCIYYEYVEKPLENTNKCVEESSYFFKYDALRALKQRKEDLLERLSFLDEKLIEVDKENEFVLAAGDCKWHLLVVDF